MPEPMKSLHNQTPAALDDPRAVEILTTEHWSLLSARTLGYQEMFGRTTIFVAVLSGAIVALAFLAQATHFNRDTMVIALLLLSVVLFTGLATFARCVTINHEDARCVAGMNLLRRAYLKMVPELQQFFVPGVDPGAQRRSLGHGSPQRLANLAASLTTASGVVATLNSVLVGTIASDLAALCGAGAILDAMIGLAVSIISGALHVRYAARFRRRHAPSQVA